MRLFTIEKESAEGKHSVPGVLCGVSTKLHSISELFKNQGSEALLSNSGAYGADSISSTVGQPTQAGRFQNPPRQADGVNPKWALSKKAVAKRHNQYRNRLIYGAQWRADIVTAYELGARTLFTLRLLAICLS